MKKILTILLIMTLLVAGCTRATESPTPMEPQDIAKAFLQASDNDDIDTGLSLLSDDVVFRQEPIGLRVEGKAQLEVGLRENIAWHHRHSFTSPFSVDGDKVTCSAKVSGDDFRISGIEYINATYEFLIRDGKIHSILVIANSEDWARLVELTSGGVGIKITVVEQGIKVEGLAANSPANEAGVKPGDVIIAVDNISYSQMRGGEMQLRIRGPVGSKVILTIIREGLTDPIKIEVTRVDLSQLRPETVVQSFKEALSRGEVDTCLSLLSDDVAFRQDPVSLTFEGKEQVKGLLTYLVTWNFDWSTTSPYSVDGNRVTFSADMRGDHYRLLGMEIVRARIEFLVNDGKISSFLITENEEDAANLDELTKGGIGVHFELEVGDVPEKGIRVLDVTENSPAQKAGIKAGDLIVAIDGVSCSQMTRPLEVQFRIMGPVEIKMLLTILREGMANPIDIEVIRADLNKPQ
ncbi:hypothetical protein ES703_86948 [subsurface metagenome]